MGSENISEKWGQRTLALQPYLFSDPLSAFAGFCVSIQLTCKPVHLPGAI